MKAISKQAQTEDQDVRVFMEFSPLPRKKHKPIESIKR